MMRKGGTAALLQKANAQLRGERVSKAPQEKDEVEAYLSGLNFKTNKQLEWDKFEEVSDISNSEDDAPKPQEVSASNKFLKKKPAIQKEKENVPVPGRSSVQPKKTFAKSSASAALDKFKAFSSKYSAKTVPKNPPMSSMLSDSDMDISLDEDVLASISKEPKKTTTSENLVGSASKVFQKQTALESDEDSFSFGKRGNKFLKKKTVPNEVKAQETEKPIPQNQGTDMPHGAKKTYQLPSSQKYSTQVKLDTDEESLADYIQGLSTSSGLTVSPPKTPREQSARKPKIKPMKSRETESEIHSQISTDDSVHGATISEVKNVEDVQFAVSDESDAGKTKKNRDKGKKTTVEKSVFQSLGLQTLDDLELEEDIEVPDEIHSRSPSPLKSILSTTPRPVTPKSNRSRVRYSIDEVTEIRSRSPSPEPVSTARQVESVVYTDEFDESTKTLTSSTKTLTSSSSSSSSSESESESSSQVTNSESGTVSSKSKTSRDENEQYSDDFDEDSRSRRDSYSSRSDDEDLTYYSDSYTSTTSKESYTSARKSAPRRKVKLKTTDTQTLPEPGLWYHWNLERGGVAILGQQYGLADVEPTPIATYTVDADALEVMTSYSPSVLAMNDMLRQQLQMTRNFIENHRRLHQIYAGSLSPDCAYTTLEDTRQYLDKHRKPRLTFDEALRQVKEEMGLS